MIGTRTAATVRTSLDGLAEQLETMRDDARDALAEVKTAAHTGSLAFGLVAIVAVVGLLVATAALMTSSRKG